MIPDDTAAPTIKPHLTGRLVCVFGISGVGKTTLISQFVREHTSWHALSASTLLSQLSNQHPNHLRFFNREKIEANQFLLVEAVQQHRRLVGPAADWLLDAHSTINNGHELVPVPPEAIARLHPNLLVFVYADAAQILRRRSTDLHRSRPLSPIQQIEAEQELALRTCLRYSSELNLRLLQISADDPAGFGAAVTKKTANRSRA